MPYPFRVTYRPDGTDITTTLWVDDRQEIANAISPEYCNDWSANVAQMQEIANPGDVGSESLAVDLAGELRRLRFKIKQIADRLNGSPVAQWYASFPGDLAVADGGTGASTPEGARANLGLGTMSTQNANAVSITGGTINDVTMGGGGITYAAKILAKQGAGGPFNPNNAGYVFAGDNDTGFFEVADGGPIDVYINGNKRYGFGHAFFDLLCGQIKFPQTQVASADSNTLDDYEEGSWTPAYARDVANPVVTYLLQVGRYIKIGRLVFVSFYTELATVTSQGSGRWYIAGLPFAPDSSLGEWGSGGGVSHYSDEFSYRNNHLASNGHLIGLSMINASGTEDTTGTISVGGSYAGFCVYLTSS